MGLADEISRLDELHRTGALTDEEFARAKSALLSAPPDVSGGPPPLPGAGLDDAGEGPRPRDPEARARDERQWSMYVHFSMLAGLLVPLAGFLLPIVLWQVKKTELPGVDAHGKIAVNWMLSLVIYSVAAVALAFVVVGIPLLIALGVVAIVFPIIGGIKASEGRVWPYPLSIPFFR
jgi:uncharacterized Tic20 family protein